MNKLSIFLLVGLIIVTGCNVMGLRQYQKQITKLQVKMDGLEQTAASVTARLDLSLIDYIALQEKDKALQTELNAISIELEQARRYGGLVEFGSKDKLMKWLYQNPVSEREFSEPSYVCSDFARDLTLDAISEGYLMGGLSRVSDKHHQKAFTIIGKNVYEIEAINDGVRLAGRIY